MNELDDDGSLSAEGKTTINSLRDILHNVTYIRMCRYSEVVIPNGILASVSQETFDEVLARFELNERKDIRRATGLDEDDTSVLIADR